MTADNRRPTWQRVDDGLYQLLDSCVVWAVDSGGGWLVINAGTGEWLTDGNLPPGPIVAVVLTHFFRDHSAGAALAAAQAIPVWAPAGERELLADARAHFQRRETWITYDNGWDLFCPLEPIAVTRWLLDWETLSVGSLDLTIIPTPGVSVGAISVLVRRPAGSSVAFCGELIHAPGKLYRIAPLQYNYNDLSGALNLLYSIKQINEQQPQWLASSTAPAVITDPDDALERLAVNLRTALVARGYIVADLAALVGDDLVRISEHLYQSKHGEASTYFVISASGKVLAIDYGYRRSVGWAGNYPFPRNRRALLHGLEALQRDHGIDRIDAVLVTHFHDDHVNGIPLLQRLFATRCYAAETFAALLSDPAAYAFPCTWPQPITVQALPVNEPFRWEEFEFTLHPMSGHTRFSTLISFECDGERVAATGDQYFFRDFAHPGTGAAQHNHVYRNGAVLSSFSDSQRILEQVAPTIILPGHGPAYAVPQSLFKHTNDYAQQYERIHRDIMPLAADDVHFEVDSRAAWIEPYRSHLAVAGPVTVTVHLRNPYAAATDLLVALRCPPGWQTAEAVVCMEPRAERAVRLVVEPPAGHQCRRQPIGVDLRAVGPADHQWRRFGIVAEAILTIGGSEF